MTTQHDGGAGRAEYLTTRQAADRLGVHRSSLLRWAAGAGVQPALVGAGRWPRWHISQLAALAGATPPATGPANDDQPPGQVAPDAWT